MLGLDGHWARQSSWALGSCPSVTLDTQMEYPRIGPFLLDISDFLEEGTVCGVIKDTWLCLVEVEGQP